MTSTHDISDDILGHARNYAIGLVRRVEGAGSQVLGSGVLVSVDGRRGILTCGHVAEAYAKLPEIGFIIFSTGDQQTRVLKLGETQTVILHSGDRWTSTGLDLAFTSFPPEIASSVGARSSFLNAERNREKVEAGGPPGARHFDAMLGLVAEFSQTPFIENGRFISPVRGILHSGHISAQKNGLLTLDPLAYNIDKMPESFGGMSGSGLWRTYFTESESGFTVIETVLVGVAAFQLEDRRIACQGWDRIDQGLIPSIREKLPL